MRVLIRVGAMMTALSIPTAADDPKPDPVQTELKKWQGFWQTSPGGMQHRDGRQVVRNPVPDGPCFFVRGDRLIWLDTEGKPTGKEEMIALDVKADPKRFTLTKVGGGEGEKPKHGIYSATGSALTVHLGLNGGPAPKRFLELNKPVNGIDGREWLISRKNLERVPPSCSGSHSVGSGCGIRVRRSGG